MTLHQVTNASKIGNAKNRKVGICRWCYEDIEEYSVISSCEYGDGRPELTFYHAGDCYRMHLMSLVHAVLCAPRFGDTIRQETYTLTNSPNDPLI